MTRAMCWYVLPQRRADSACAGCRLGTVSPVRSDYTELGLLSILDDGLNATGRNFSLTG
jgi:hypothetical protein